MRNRFKNLQIWMWFSPSHLFVSAFCAIASFNWICKKHTQLIICTIFLFRIAWNEWMSGRRNVNLAHIGACTKLKTNVFQCNEKCTETDKATGPICASDGNTYRTLCEMKEKTCGRSVGMFETITFLFSYRFFFLLQNAIWWAETFACVAIEKID